MRLTLTKALALALVASLIPGRRSLEAGLVISASPPVRPADPAIAPTPDQCKPTDAPS